MRNDNYLVMLFLDESYDFNEFETQIWSFITGIMMNLAKLFVPSKRVILDQDSCSSRKRQGLIDTFKTTPLIRQYAYQVNND